MTREEEILSYLEDVNPREIASHIERGTLHQWIKKWKAATSKSIISALRPVSRERVERVWRGEWMFQIFGDQQDENDPRCQCSKCGSIETPLVSHRFCPHCGAPMTDEAVDIVLSRLEVLKDGKSD